MAAAKADKTKAKKSKSNGSSMVGLASKIMGLCSIILAGAFFAAMFDIGHIYLLYILKDVSLILVPLYVLLGIATLFLTPKPGSDIDELAAKVSAMSDMHSKFTSQIIALQGCVDSSSGNDIESLRAKNKELQEQLDAIHAAERAEADGQIEVLRKRNEELEEQIKKWALETVNKTIKGETPSADDKPMQAA